MVRLGVTPGVLVGYESERGWEFKISFRMRFSSEARLISSSTVVHSFCRRTTSSSIDLMYIFWRSRWFLCSDLDFDMLLMGEREGGSSTSVLSSPALFCGYTWRSCKFCQSLGLYCEIVLWQLAGETRFPKPLVDEDLRAIEALADK